MAFNESMPDEVDFYNEQLGDKKLKKMIESVYHNEQTSDKRIKGLIEEKYQFETFDAETLDKVIEDASLRKQIDKIYNRETPLEEYKLRKILPSLYAIDRGWLTIQMLDAIKACGYKNATFYGATLSMDDILVPEEKEAMVAEANKEVEKIVGQWNSGAITADERYNKSVTVWENTNEKLTNLMMDNLAKHKDGFNTIYMMATSGARGSKKQISQLAAMRGLMQKPNGDIIELPIRANFKEGLSVIEFFI